MEPLRDRLRFNPVEPMKDIDKGKSGEGSYLKVEDRRVLNYLFELTQRNLSNSNYAIVGYALSLISCIFLVVLTTQNLLYIEQELLVGTLWSLPPLLLSLYLVVRVTLLLLKIRSYKRDSQSFFEEISQDRGTYSVSGIVRIYNDSNLKATRLRWISLTLLLLALTWILVVSLDGRVGFVTGISNLFPLRFWSRPVSLGLFTLLLELTLLSLSILTAVRLLFARLRCLEVEHYISESWLKEGARERAKGANKAALIASLLVLAVTWLLLLILLGGKRGS